MDAGDPIIRAEVSHQNRDPKSGNEGVIMETVNVVSYSTAKDEWPNESIETAGHTAESSTPDSLAEKDGEGSNLLEEVHGLTISKESRVEEKDITNYSKKGLGRGAPEKHLTFVKKNKDGNIGSVTSKKPFAVATNRRLSNDRHMSKSITGVDSSRPTKLASARGQVSQRTGKSWTASPDTGATESEGLREQAKNLKNLKQGMPAKVEGNTHFDSLSPKEGGTKPQRMGGLPSYGFSFKCDERAQKRKDFYAKLEEKIHAKEVERTTMQAKSQESQEAEIKMLRKSLMFKATPMPSFYHEPVPSKVELKKIPPTRAKSPKLGRNKSSLIADSDGNSSHSSQSGRLSLDEKVAQNCITKGSSSQHHKKPLRKSLPRLPSEKTTLADAKEDDKEITHHPEQHKMKPEAGKTSDPSQTQINVDAEPVGEEQEQASESEPIATEHSAK